MPDPDTRRRAGLIGRPSKEASSQVITSPASASSAAAGSSLSGGCLIFGGFLASKGVTSTGLLGDGMTFEVLKTSAWFASRGLRGSQESQPMIQSTQLDIPS